MHSFLNQFAMAVGWFVICTWALIIGWALVQGLLVALEKKRDRWQITR